ncbi:MAG: PilZ domain-containing protein, partial [Phycisphaerae bacterium]|nr:PilZ domain-containing protein [Phycisphaerae bacterium]
PAIRYRWPQTLTELQRRAYYRTLVPRGVTLLAAMWSGGVPARAAATEDPPQIVTGDLLDLSCGGCLIRVNQAQAPPWSDNATLGAEIQMPDGRQPLVLNANYRGPRYDGEGRLCLAIQFVGLEMTADGRALLQRLASNIQRFHRWAGSADTSGRPEHGI